MCICLCKQKTAYGIRISDWYSYVCSSDLIVAPREILSKQILAVIGLRRQAPEVAADALDHETVDSRLDRLLQGERFGFVGRDPRLDFEQFLECDIDRKSTRLNSSH